MTTKTTKEISYVEQHIHPDKFVTIIERYEPCKEGEKSTAFFGRWPDFKPMKLVSRRTEDGREI